MGSGLTLNPYLVLLGEIIFPLWVFVSSIEKNQSTDLQILMAMYLFLWLFIGQPRWLSGLRIYLQCRSFRSKGFDPWVRKIPWRRTWQPTPVSLPGESHEQRNMAGYSPWDCKESDTTEVTEHAHTWLIIYKRNILPVSQI